MIEEVVGRLKTSFGIDKFHNLINAMGLEVLFRTGLGKGYVTVFPIAYAGKYRYFVGAVWDEYAIGPTFLRRAFDQRVVADLGALDKEKSSFYHRLDPGTYIKKKPVSFMAFDGFRFDLFATSNDNRQIMANLLKRASRSKVLLKHETKGEEATMFVAYPGQNLGVYMIGIQQNITHLKEIEDIRAIMFLAGMVLFVLFSVLAAVNISASFTNPLQHLLWGLGEVQKNNYSIKLKDSREDEFGSISKAFNLMTRRLQEKDVLGRFVSDSVKKLAANPELLKKAREGSEEEVTILFCSLKGFARIALQESESEIQKILEFSLRKFFARAEEYGGEIDKVIGEKILIVFPHRKTGRKKAVAAAISLVKNINKDFAIEKQVKPVFGLNIGKVISGIIGTPAVRMDYTVIGDPVNVAARLCSVAEDFDQTLVTSGLVCETAGKTEKFEKIEIEKIKGKKQEVEVFKVKV
jgi:class 3 adenylate cyclase